MLLSIWFGIHINLANRTSSSIDKISEEEKRSTLEENYVEIAFLET